MNRSEFLKLFSFGAVLPLRGFAAPTPPPVGDPAYFASFVGASGTLGAKQATTLTGSFFPYYYEDVVYYHNTLSGFFASNATMLKVSGYVALSKAPVRFTLDLQIHAADGTLLNTYHLADTPARVANVNALVIGVMPDYYFNFVAYQEADGNSVTPNLLFEAMG